MGDLLKHCIEVSANIRNAVKKMDDVGLGFILVIEKNCEVVGIITDGDFRRSILEGVDLNDPVVKVMNRNFKFLNEGFSDNDAFELFDENVEHIPVLNEKLLTAIVKKSDFDTHIPKLGKTYHQFRAPVLIMAGGVGSRMEPFTKILPKPLIPVGDKTMIEIIMDEYAKFGLFDFFISVNYKAKMIQSYFEYTPNNFVISYVTEEKPLGTGGALKLLDKVIDVPFFVSNCDIIIKDDYYKIYKFHQQNSFVLTIVTAMQHFRIPYGVCEIDTGGKLKNIMEKPEYDFLVNTGMYVINPEVLDLIPSDAFYNVTDLIGDLLERGANIGVYPVSEKSYIDVGQWAEYRKAIDVLTI